jgi:hypothetical protein
VGHFTRSKGAIGPKGGSGSEGPFSNRENLPARPRIRPGILPETGRGTHGPKVRALVQSILGHIPGSISGSTHSNAVFQICFFKDISMYTAVAYIIVIVLGQFAFTGGMLTGILLTMPINLFLDWIFEDNLRISTIRAGIIGFVVGLFASIGVVLFGWLVFRYLVGPVSFGLFPFLACVASMILPIFNDWTKHRGMQNLTKTTKDQMGADAFSVVEAVTAPVRYAFGVVFAGEIIGMLLSVGYLLM